MGKLIKNAKIINENKTLEADLLIEGQIITKISSSISVNHHDVIDIKGNFFESINSTSFSNNFVF